MHESVHSAVGAATSAAGITDASVMPLAAALWAGAHRPGALWRLDVWLCCGVLCFAG